MGPLNNLPPGCSNHDPHFEEYKTVEVTIELNSIDIDLLNNFLKYHDWADMMDIAKKIEEQI
jgi:hypothetical protein